MAKKKYQSKVEWDDMSYGEAAHHIGKKMTKKVVKSKKDYKRKPKSNTWLDELDDIG